jgi:hypothetical protein
MTPTTPAISLEGLMILDSLERADYWLERCMCELMRCPEGSNRWLAWNAHYHALATAHELCEWKLIDAVCDVLEQCTGQRLEAR